jgi:hypothetical protein
LQSLYSPRNSKEEGKNWRYLAVKLGVKTRDDSGQADSEIETDDSSGEEEEPYASAVNDLAKVVVELRTTASYRVLKHRLREVRLFITFVRFTHAHYRTDPSSAFLTFHLFINCLTG